MVSRARGMVDLTAFSADFCHFTTGSSLKMLGYAAVRRKKRKNMNGVLGQVKIHFLVIVLAGNG
uniref:Uncharacterized protein n=1 Tax=Solanum lycopersicum TaxID=4081 RepID=A0A3Q7FLH6_SOLLC